MADCTGINKLTNLVGCGAQAAVEDGASSLGEAMMKSYDSILKDFATSWLGKGMLVDLSTSSSLAWFQVSISAVTVFLVVMGLMLAGIKTMMDRNGRPLREVAESLGKVVFVTVAGSLAVQVFVVGGDAFGKWILKSAGLDSGTFTVATTALTASPGLAIIIGIFGILTVLIQWGVMFVRGAILPLLVAWWPVSAAAAMLEGGKKSFEGVTRWIIAFLIYSPVAASIYALAWRLKNGKDGVGGVVNGWVLIVLAVLTLPALLRLIAPATSAMGKMAGGVMAMGMTTAAVGAGIAVGAAVATGGASAGASGAAAGGGSAGGPAAGGGSGSGGGPSVASGAGGQGVPGPGGSDGAGGKHAANPAEGATGAGGSAGSAGSAGSDGSGLIGGSGADGASSSPPSSNGGGVAQGASDASPAGGSASSGGGRASGWDAAQGALDSSDGNDGTAEGMYSE